MNSPGEYDPMSVHADIDAIYSRPEVTAHAVALRAISQERAQRHRTRISVQTIMNDQIAELFGISVYEGYVSARYSRLNNDATTEDEVTVVENS
jgi:hypothetical protein